MTGDDSGRWTRAERLALFGVIATVLGALAAWLVVPGIAGRLGAGSQAQAPIINNYQKPTPTKTKPPKENKNRDTVESPSPEVDGTSQSTNRGTDTLDLNSQKRDVAQDGFIFGYPSCKAAGGKVICEFTVTNVESEQRRLQLIKLEIVGNARTYLVDRTGHQYLAPGLRFGAFETTETLNSILNNYVTQDLESNVPMNAVFKFDVPQSVKGPVTVVVAYSVLSKGRNAVFRGVPVE